MLFKRGDKFTLVVKNDTHKGNPNKYTMLRYGIFDKDSKFLVSKNQLTFFDTTAKEYRRMKLTNIFGITNISRMDREQESQTPSFKCRAKKCDNDLYGWTSKIDKRYCQDCL